MKSSKKGSDLVKRALTADEIDMVGAAGPPVTDYTQNGGDYTQSTGGDHSQYGGGGYNQSLPSGNDIERNY